LHGLLEYKMLSRHVKELLLLGILAIMAMIGLIMLVDELSKARRRRKKREVLRFPSRKPPSRKAS
jgi:hypothetical protein